MKISLISPIMCLNEELSIITKQMMHDIRLGMNKECEFIIVDNASTHCTKEMSKNADIYVKLPKNKGWGGGINVGMKLASGKYFIFVNNDISIKQSGWVEKLISRFESNLKIGAISMNCKDGFSGAFFAIRKKVYEKIGDFDEKNFPLGLAQDCDYLYRLLKESWDVDVLIIDSYKHYNRKTFNQKQFKDRYLQHDNFSKSSFKKKWNFEELEWEVRGQKDRKEY